MEVLKDTLTDEQRDEAYQARLARCIPVARKMFMIIAKNLETIELGDSQKCLASVGPTAGEIMQLFVDEDVHWTDKAFIGSLALQPIAHVGEVMETSFEMSWDKAIGILFGKDVLDLKFTEVDEILKRKPEVVE